MSDMSTPDCSVSDPTKLLFNDKSDGSNVIGHGVKKQMYTLQIFPLPWGSADSTFMRAKSNFSLH